MDKYEEILAWQQNANNMDNMTVIKLSIFLAAA